MFSIVFAQGILKNAATCTPPNCANALTDLETIFSNVISAAIPLAGMVLFVFLLLAGFNWISAGADPKKAEAARNMATYAVIGVVALALSYLVIRLVAYFTGNAQIETFKIYQP